MQKPKFNPFFKKRLWLIFVPLVAYFIFGFYHLTKFETADEHYWLYSNTVEGSYWNMNDGRIEQYWMALSKGDWVKTRINDKPGVTLAYVSGVGSFLKTRLDHSIMTGTHPAMDKISKAQLVNLYFRLPQLIFLGLFSLLLFFLLKKLTDSFWIALFFYSFGLLSPAIIGISQIINPDALLWAFGFAAMLSYFLHLKENSKSYAFLAALFFGLCLLTKYTSVILIPFFLLVMFSYIIEYKDEWKDDLLKRTNFHAVSYLAVVSGGLLIYAILLPDNLINFGHFLKGSIGLKGSYKLFILIFVADLLLLADGMFFKNYLLEKSYRFLAYLQKIAKYLTSGLALLIFLAVILDVTILRDKGGLFIVPFDASAKQFFAFGITWRVALRQFMPLIFSLSPLVLLLSLYTWLLSLAKAKKLDKQTSWLVFMLSSFLLLFIAASSKEAVPLTMRYSIMLYPIMFALAAIGLAALFDIEKKKFTFQAGLFLLIIAIGLVSLWQAKPFYFNYTNSLLPDKYVIADGWGYGGFEIAQYLNNMPNSSTMRIWSDYNGVCVFFNGSCVANKLTMQDIQESNVSSGKGLPQFSYFISSRRGTNTAKDLWEDLKDEYGSKKIYTLTIGGRPANSLSVYENK
jgi:4-amino-4-deoxy-L-arabinose transferase-like glycosyltransferase